MTCGTYFALSRECWCSFVRACGRAGGWVGGWVGAWVGGCACVCVCVVRRQKAVMQRGDKALPLPLPACGALPNCEPILRLFLFNGAVLKKEGYGQIRARVNKTKEDSCYS